MNKSSWVGLRLVAVLAVVIASPILAVPCVHRGLTTLWTGADVDGSGQSTPPRAATPSTSSPRRVTVRLSAPRAGSHPLQRPAGASVPSPGDHSASVASRCRQIERELKELGAASLRMEVTPDSADRYHFYCDFPVAGTTAYRRPYQAKGPTAVGVMEDVLVRVRARFAQFPSTNRLPDTDRR